jgi:8-oxo-dGTP pyrophosphatase MutT (NUDIX family)
VTFDVERTASRIVLVDDEERILLFCMHDPDRPARGEWWITPGGGLELDESYEDAARRELFEETGIVADVLGPVVNEGVATWMWGERTVRQLQRFFVVRTTSSTVTDDGWEESERRTTKCHRWWTLEEIATTGEVILPENLGEFARQAIEIAATLE